jgi:hypothetical protein
MNYQCANNIRDNPATVAGQRSSSAALLEVRYKFDGSMFDVDSLTRTGKWAQVRRGETRCMP